MKHLWNAIAWWEARRIPFNVAIFIAGLATLAVVELIGSHYAYPGEDVEEPFGIFLGIFVYALVANIAYTLGWITELLWLRGDVSRGEMMRPKVFKAGLLFSIGLTLLPAVLVPLAWAIFGFHHDPK